MLFSGILDTTRLDGSLKQGSLTLMLDGAESLTYDRAGRLWSRWTRGATFRRGLDGRVMEKRTEQGRRVHRWLSAAEIDALLDESARRMRTLAEQITAGCITWTIAPEDDQPAEVMHRAALFDARANRTDGERFAQVYGPIGILPPDQYLALVLQATTGCSFNSCTFCNFYAAQPFHVKSADEFRNHARAVRAFMGDSLAVRRSIFLGEANALAISFSRLTELIRIAKEAFGDWPIYVFLDAFSGARKSIVEYRQLADLGLKRVSIGLESGHDPLLRFVRKPGTARHVSETVAAIKAAGVAVSLIVIIGLGGDRYAAAHAADTAAMLNSLPLGKGDILYFSNLVEHRHTPYPALARAAGIRPLDTDEMGHQRQSIRDALRFDAGGPVVSRYDLAEFVY